MSSAESSEFLLRTLALVSVHPAVSHVGAPLLNEANGVTALDVTFEVNLPSEWRRRGESPSGVRLKEVVRFDFPSDFPMKPPGLALRPDFNRNLPHMQPWLLNGRSVPCIYDGDLAELLQQEGMAGILNQTAVWLERAALGTLIDPEQGWEPVRRDSFEDYLVADADSLRQLVDRNGGYRFFELLYGKIIADSNSRLVLGRISHEVKINQNVVRNLFKEMEGADGDLQFRHGKSLALVVWPGKHPSGELIVNDTYLPETVCNIRGLRKRATLYSCTEELNTGIKWLGRCVSKYPEHGPFTLAVIFLARRPFKVIGSQSCIELCPYIVDIRFPDLFAEGDATLVRPAAHRNTISRSLLAQMTGSAATPERPRWTLFGAGSLGSKLALHLARVGNGPEVILDKSLMAPHNAARHALVPTAGFWMDTKARVLCNELRGLDQKATPVTANVVNILMSKGGARHVWSKHSWAVVNATASLTVREAIAASRLVSTRIIETALFASGRVGMITVEGPSRNPNTADLMAECYAFLRENAALAHIFFGNEIISREGVGEGCGSLTMTMSDGRLSIFAAGMSEYLLAKQRDGLPDGGGEILIGQLSDDEFGLKWYARRVPPVTVVHAKNRKAWRVHIHSRVVEKIVEEAARWPKVETGGVLMGRISEASRTFHIVDVLEPPEDSSRSASEFVLGTKGLLRQIKDYSEAAGWSLYCLGTWHSHIYPSGPSVTDRETAKAISLARLTPSLLLIRTPECFDALLADVADASARRN